MTRSRRLLYLTFSGLAVLVLTLAVTTCSGGSGSGSSSGAPTSPSSSGSATNSGTVAGSGTCQYTATPTAFDVALPGQGGGSFGVPAGCTNISCLLEIPVTVTGLDSNGEPCQWWAESHTQSNDWVDIESAVTGSGVVNANNGVVSVTGNGTVQFSLADEAALNNNNLLQPTDYGNISCESYDDTDYTMNPVTVEFDYAGGAGPEITVDVISPKTREGSILIRTVPPSGEATIQLFEIPIVQHGSVCSWYLASANCTYVPNGTCTDPITLATPASDWIFINAGAPTMTEGSGTASFAVSAGDVPAGSLAPRDGVIMLYDETFDKNMGVIYIEQLGEPAEDEVPECTYNYSISQTEFYGFAGGTAELTVFASPATCGWHAEASAASEDWIAVSYTNAPCPGGVCYGTQQVQVVVQDGDVGSPPIPGMEGRSGTVIIYKEVGGIFEPLFTVPITQFRQDP